MFRRMTSWMSARSESMREPPASAALAYSRRFRWSVLSNLMNAYLRARARIRGARARRRRARGAERERLPRGEEDVACLEELLELRPLLGRQARGCLHRLVLRGLLGSALRLAPLATWLLEAGGAEAARHRPALRACVGHRRDLIS